MRSALGMFGPNLDVHLLLVYFSGLRFQGQPELPRQNIRLTNFFQYHWMALRDVQWRGHLFYMCDFF